MSSPSPLTPVLLLMACTLSGCTFHDAAPTILHLDAPNQTDAERVTFGIKEIGWALDQQQPVIVGRGWHPREHENYAVFLNEGYPLYQPRWLRMVPLADDRTWQIELGLVPDLLPEAVDQPPDVGSNDLIWLRGQTTERPLRDARQIRFEFESVPMQSVREPNARVLLSGRVQAERDDSASFDALRESLEQRRHNVASDEAPLP